MQGSLPATSTAGPTGMEPHVQTMDQTPDTTPGKPLQRGTLAYFVSILPPELIPALTCVVEERLRQDRKFGQHSADTMELGTSREWAPQRDLVRAITDRKMQEGTATFHDLIHEEDLESYAEEGPQAFADESVQCIAIRLKCLVALERRGTRPSPICVNCGATPAGHHCNCGALP